MTPHVPVPRRFLFAHWEGGGNTPPMLAIVRRLVARGQNVRILSDACNEAEAEAAGASFSSWKRVPRRPDKSAAHDPIRDWEVRSPLRLVARARDRILVGPALGYARDLLEALERFPADVVVTSELLLGVMAAAESAPVPCVGLSANIYPYPLPGIPPFGPGLRPAKGMLGQLREQLVQGVARLIVGKGTTSFNSMRHALGLLPLAHPFEQTSRVARQLILTSPAFDFPAVELPPHVVYAGPVLDDPPWAEPWSSPWTCGDPRPLVLIGFSTTFQNQADVLRRVIGAFRLVDARAVLTAGPAIPVADLPAAPNVHVCRTAPHALLLKESSAVVTHAGHGTVIRALASGVPLLCMPMGRDQHDNAARVVARGAGLRLSPRTGAKRIREAILELLGSPRYRERAREIGALVREDAHQGQAVTILEDIAAQHERRAGTADGTQRLRESVVGD